MTVSAKLGVVVVIRMVADIADLVASAVDRDAASHCSDDHYKKARNSTLSDPLPSISKMASFSAMKLRQGCGYAKHSSKGPAMHDQIVFHRSTIDSSLGFHDSRVR